MNTAVRSVILSGCSAGFGAFGLLSAMGIVASPRGSVRVAFLPSLMTLGVCVVGGALIVLGLSVLLARLSGASRDPGTPLVPEPIADAWLPLHASWILLLPYLPWLPDAVPVLRVAGAMAKYAIAGLILLQVAVALGSALRRTSARSAAGSAAPARSRRMRGAAVVFAASLVASSLAAARLTNTALFPSGDEPHYLVIAQSLWRDADLKIEDNHRRGDYLEYFPRDLAPHYVTRGKDQQIYSIHPIGVSVLMAPVYAIGGYLATVAMQMLMAAFAIALAWWWGVRRSGSSGAATWAWASIALGTPWLINAFTIYPEIGGALFGMGAFYAATTWERRATSLVPWLVAGCCVAALPWFSTKYAPMSAMLVLVALARAWRDDESRVASPVAASLAVVVPYALSLAGWFAFFHAIWGTFSPSAPYGTDNQTNPLFLRSGGLGLLFDQEYGLLAFTPAAVLAATGAFAMWQRGGALRRQIVEIAVVAGALFGTVGAFRIWWGGSAGPGRPIIAALALLLLPIAVAMSQARTAFQRAGHRLLVLVGVALAATIVIAQRGLLLAAGRDGTSGLLQWWSPSWHLTEMAPSLIAHKPLEASVFIAIWLAAAFAVGAWLARRGAAAGRGRAALAATGGMFVAVVGITIVVENSLASAQQGAVVAEERSRSILLDRYDATRRPVAVLYAPFSHLRPAEVLPWLVLGSRGELPATGISVPIALNARVSLPAGRYRARAHALTNLAAPVEGTLGVQVGRMSDPITSDTVTLAAGQTWTREFTIDIDCNFVGIRASREMSRALREVWFDPLSVVDAHARARVPEVLAVRSLGSVRVYFHDEHAWPEPAGFWTRGRDEAEFTLVAPSPTRAVLRLTAGPIANHVSLDIGGKRVELDVAANSHHEVPVEVSSQPLRLRVRTRGGFVPIERDPSARDRRRLGAWFELVP